MKPDKEMEVNGKLIQEYYWNGRQVVYVNHTRYEGTFEDAMAEYLGI